MTPKTYTLLNRCIEEGIVQGVHDAERDGCTSGEDFVEKVRYAIMLAICEVFSFGDEQQ